MRFDIHKELNEAQLKAAMATEGPVLVIAGAGSGKTRTIVYRLAHLVREGLDPQSILLLTFTRKASQEMLNRAGRLLGQGLNGVVGGTFHSFAYAMLRRYSRALGLAEELTILDKGDSEQVVAQVRESQGIGKGDRSFPKKGTISSLISKSRNKELGLQILIENEARHLLVYGEDLQAIADSYSRFKREYGLLDYDDLLFYCEKLLTEHEGIRDFLRLKYQHILVDEYQDTNLVQGRIVSSLAGPGGNVMAVGDDAQSIYSFRGATVANILRFSESFPGARIIKLEQNYRSVQPILSLSNQILERAEEKYEKNLFTERSDGQKPELLRPISDHSQSRVVLNKIEELAREYPLHEIAVLFRSGFQSYNLEVALNKQGIPFKKFGGQKFTEAAHIKDVLAYLRLAANPADLPAWQRAMTLIPKVGPKTCQRLYDSIVSGDGAYLARSRRSNEDLDRAVTFIHRLQEQKKERVFVLLEQVLEFYQPLLKSRFPDDYPRRQAGLDELSQIAAAYEELDLFLSDLCLENPDQLGQRDPLEDNLVLSTVHSAKGLEWQAVIIIDLVEERFPSKHALMDKFGMEEERRLFYVACTRAKEYLGLSMPDSLYNRYQRFHESALASPFVLELSPDGFDEFREDMSGTMLVHRPIKDKKGPSQAKKGGDRQASPDKLGHCRHKIFGRGKVVQFFPPNRYQVNFPGFGLKKIMGDYLEMEE
ncbi:MAG: ATP-dependent helicase [Desulfohalobiaceae bacterium]|nr:ATP-dependent helicase [Desulfohalobiaceae bacterium]